MGFTPPSWHLLLKEAAAAPHSVWGREVPAQDNPAEVVGASRGLEWALVLTLDWKDLVQPDQALATPQSHC